MKKVFITGGAGYVGAVLVPQLLKQGYEITVIDLMIYGAEVLPDHPNLKSIRGDIRDTALLEREMADHDAVIHLACISNDPSFELNPTLGKTINLDAFEPMVKAARKNGVKRFIYASSASVYGIKSEPDVVEDMELEPLTDYSIFKAACERILNEYSSASFETVIIRPATLCGYSPRLRLDLTVNILTNLAINKGEITVFGGQQKRPNLHINDMVDLYSLLLKLPGDQINSKVFNAGYENFRVAEIAEMVRNIVGDHIKITTTPSNDDRSYHISSEKIKREIGFSPSRTLEDASADLKQAFEAGKIPDSLSDDRYFNVKRMQNIHLD